MSRPGTIQIENKFVKGLITENTAIAFPTDAVTDTDNCVFDYTGRITRRLGIDLEGNYVTTNTFTPVTGEVWTEFIWRNVAGHQTQSFVVQQRGSTILFFDISTSTEVGANIVDTTIDLTTYLPSGSSNDPATVPCQYAQGNGKMIIVNEYTDPILVEYEVASANFTVTAITVTCRDFEGVEDGLGLTERPTATVAGIKTSNPEHYYNILNQGWALTDALSQWDISESTLPSNADMIAFYRVDDTDAFGTTRLAAKSPGNTPALRGHFILNVGELDRTAALVDEGFTGATIPGGAAFIPAADGTIIGDFGADAANAFNDDTYEVVADTAQLTATNGYIGKDWGASTTHTIGRVMVVGSHTSGVANSYSGDIVCQVYGKATAPANSTDGTLIGTLTFADTSGSDRKHSIEITDLSTAYRYHWVRFERAVPASTDWCVSEVQFYEVGTSFKRPRCVTFFAGRAWYAGVDSATESSTVFFSQIIQDDVMYGKCYQKNDPTNERIADLLDDDGGAIKIPEIGRIERLYPFQSQLLVFASNGVWLIKGSGASSYFKATDYQVSRITSIGVFSPESVIDVRNVPVWWAEDGIYTVTYDARYDSTAVTSLTETTIKTFIQDIPALNRRFVKGAFDRLNDTAYWLFNDTGSLGEEDYYSYNRVLCLNSKTGAFYPWTFGLTGTNSPTIRGIMYIQDGARADNFLVKYPIEYTESGTTYHSFADVVDDGYQDWITYDTIISGTQTVDYESYFITGYRIDAQLLKYFQTNYVLVFLEQETNASCFVQGLWDFSNAADSGKWSTAQQIYNAYTTKGRSYRDVNHRRLKVRGKGKALQLKFYGATGKPFTIIGWGLVETANASL